MDARSRHCTRFSGAPAFTAAAAMTSDVRRQHFTARGCGACTIALPALTAARLLKITVDVGFVTGMIAAITPMGLPIAVIRPGPSTQSTPLVRIPTIESATNSAL